MCGYLLSRLTVPKKNRANLWCGRSRGMYRRFLTSTRSSLSFLTRVSSLTRTPVAAANSPDSRFLLTRPYRHSTMAGGCGSCSLEAGGCSEAVCAPARPLHCAHRVLHQDLHERGVIVVLVHDAVRVRRPGPLEDGDVPDRFVDSPDRIGRRPPAPPSRSRAASLCGSTQDRAPCTRRPAARARPVPYAEGAIATGRT